MSDQKNESRPSAKEDKENTLYQAMSLFSNLSEVVAFSSDEVALFHVLLNVWNAARRPEIVQQWASTTKQRSGLSVPKIADARKKLSDKGVIYFLKESNRKVPKYSLNALFELPDPLLPENDSKPVSKDCSKSGSKHASKRGSLNKVSSRVSSSSSSRPPKSPKGDLVKVDEIYQSYPKKVGKKSALKAITKALKTTDHTTLLERTKAYAKAVEGGDPQFIPYPAKWFRDERYSDDPSTWSPSPSSSSAPDKPRQTVEELMKGKVVDIIDDSEINQ